MHFAYVFLPVFVDLAGISLTATGDRKRTASDTKQHMKGSGCVCACERESFFVLFLCLGMSLLLFFVFWIFLFVYDGGCVYIVYIGNVRVCQRERLFVKCRIVCVWWR